MSKTPKTLRHVFRVLHDNTLQLVRVRFGEHIESVEPEITDPVDWANLARAEQKERWIRSVAPRLAPLQADEIDGRFLLLMPGAIDPHVHFDTPGFEFREDFEHASLAAAFGGVTTIIDMPCTSVPPVTNLPNLQTKLQTLQNRSFVDFAFWGGISGTDFSDESRLHRQILELAEAGVVGFKAYLISGMEKFTDLTPAQMRRAAELVRTTGLPLAVHAEDKSLVTARRRKFQAEGRHDWQAYCAARDVQAEEKAVGLMAEICRQTGARVHIVHLSSQRGLQIVRQTRSAGLPFSAETCPHYLHFTQNDFERPEIRNFLKTAPPVKFEADRQALWQGLAEGTLAFVTTDHAGCDPQQEKGGENFWQVYGGIPGVEHRVPFLLSEGFLQGRLTLQQTVRLLAGHPAQFFGLERKGDLQPGKDADFALIDLWQPWTVRASEMHSKGKYTPFEGLKLNACVERTFLRGNLIVDKRLTLQPDKRTGQFVTRG